MNVEIVDAEAALSPARITDAERRLGVRFPAAYRAHLLKHNGGRPRPGGFDIGWDHDGPASEDWRTSCFGWFLAIGDLQHSNLIAYNTADFKDRIPKGTLAIAYDAGGNLMLLALKGPYAGKVLFWVKDHEVEEGDEPGYDNVGILADSFEEFMDSRLRERRR